MKIFVQIASYRDSELASTIRDCIQKAKNPNNLTFGICWQKDEKENLNEFIINPKFRIIEISWQESKGVGWARSLIQELYEGEEYTLQIDSHHRFAKNWDESLIEMIEKTDSKKPILSSFAGAYNPKTGEKLSIEPYKMIPEKFTEDGQILIRPFYSPDLESLTSPVRARFVCGHFIFAKGEFCKEYKYDPNIYFEGDDLSLSVRLFTLGYDLFHPNKNVLWHEYTREGRAKHWLNHDQSLKDQNKIEKTWWERDLESKKRIRKLLNQESNDVDLGVYGLGTQRTLKDYEIYAGVDFLNKKIQQSAVFGSDPPCVYENEQQWQKGFEAEVSNSQQKQEEEQKNSQTEYRVKANWDIDQIEKADDYEFWYFGFHDESNKEIYREDFRKGTHDDILNFRTDTRICDFSSETIPKTFTIWPVSKSKGWLTKIVFSIE